MEGAVRTAHHNIPILAQQQPPLSTMHEHDRCQTCKGEEKNQ